MQSWSSAERGVDDHAGGCGGDELTSFTMLLVIIVDVPASRRALDDVIFSVLGLAKAYLMLDRRNELRVYAASSAPLFGGSSSDEDARDPAVLLLDAPTSALDR